MAGKGAVPRGYQSRDSDQARRQPQTGLKWDGEVRGYDLPTGRPWHPATVQWWEMWRRSPMAMVWIDSDWSFLIETAVLHDQYFSRPSHLVAAELRQRGAKMGITYEDRARLKMQILDDKSDSDNAKLAEVTAIHGYRGHLTGSSG